MRSPDPPRSSSYTDAAHRRQSDGETHQGRYSGAARRRSLGWLAHGAAEIQLFGSVARDEAAETSDVDFLVTPAAITPPFFPGGLIAALEDLLGHDVQITLSSPCMGARLRETIARDLVALHPEHDPEHLRYALRCAARIEGLRAVERAALFDNLEPWGADDLPLLTALLGDPAMTAHLGGPESPEQLAARQERYVRLTATGAARMFKSIASATGEPVGSVGFWQRTWHDAPVYAIGWSVLIPFQGRGIAARATALAIDRARAGERRFLHAFPGIDNLPSNTPCRKLGFTLLNECTFAYPVGSSMRRNDWCLDLHAD